MATISVGRTYSNGKSEREVIDVDLHIEQPTSKRKKTVTYVRDKENIIRTCTEMTFIRWLEGR